MAKIVNHPADQINNFLKEFKASGKNSLSARNYRLYLDRFLNWLNQTKLSLEKINAQHLQNYKNWLSGSKYNLKNSTIDYHLIALRSFSRYLKKQNLSGPKISDIKLSNDKPNQYLYQGDPSNQLKQAIKLSTGPELIKLRDLAIVELLLNCGLKVSEVSGLTRSDFNEIKNQLIIKNKSLPDRQLDISSLVSLAIKQYLEKRHDTVPALFINHDRAGRYRLKTTSQALSPRSIQRLIKNYSKASGLEQIITPSYLRKLFGQRLAQNNIDPKLIKKLMGYKHLNNLKRYWIKK